MRGHMVRRLWPEKVHDAIAQSSNILLQRPVKREYHPGNAVPEPLDTPTAFETRNAVPPWLSCTATANDQVRSGDGSHLSSAGPDERQLCHEPHEIGRVGVEPAGPVHRSSQSAARQQPAHSPRPVDATTGSSNLPFRRRRHQGRAHHRLYRPDGSATADPGWSRGRPVNPEDIEATTYVAVGIEWTTVRHEDPFVRGFEYVPSSEQTLYGPINGLSG